MTALVLNYSQSLLEGLWNGLKKTLQGFMIGWMVARQTQANYHVANFMIRSGEYKESDYYWLLSDLNAKTIAKIKREISGD